MACCPRSSFSLSLSHTRRTHVTHTCHTRHRRYPDVIVHRLLAAALQLAAQRGEPDGSELLARPLLSPPPPQPPSAVDYSEVMYDPGFAAARSAAGGGDKDGGDGSSAAPPPTAAPPAAADSRRGGDDEEEQGAAEGDEGEADPLAEALLLQHGLPPGKEVERIAQHANDTKQSARAASDGSLRLYLCIMLREHPVVTMAVSLGVAGDRFFAAYLPEFGCE